MELKELEYFAAIAQYGSIKKAAEHLYISQSALSQFLIRLEARIGSPLVLRTHSGISLTPCGEIYLDTVLKILALRTEALSRIQAAREKEKRHLKIGVTGMRSFFFASLLMQQMYRLYPDMHFEVVKDTSWNFVQNRLRGVDFALGALISPCPLLSFELCHAEPIYLLLPKEHPLFQSGAVSPEEPVRLEALTNTLLVLPPSSSSLGLLCSRYLAEHGLAIQPSLVYDSIEFLIHYLNSERQATLLPVSYAEQLENYISLPLPEPTVYKLGAYYQPAPEDGLFSAFLSLIRENGHLY